MTSTSKGDRMEAFLANVSFQKAFFMWAHWKCRDNFVVNYFQKSFEMISTSAGRCLGNCPSTSKSSRISIIFITDDDVHTFDGFQAKLVAFVFFIRSRERIHYAGLPDVAYPFQRTFPTLRVTWQGLCMFHRDEIGMPLGEVHEEWNVLGYD